MDIAVHLETLWRHRLLLAVGLVAAATLATLSFVRVDSDGVSFRQQEQWESSGRLLATKRGYPFKSNQFDTTPFAVLVSQYASSDAVTAILARSGPINGTVFANAEQLDSEYLPFIRVSAVSATPEAAGRLARRAMNTLRKYVDARQARLGIPKNGRFVLETVNEPGSAMLVQGRKKTRPVMIFLALLSLVVGFAYVLENIKVSRQPSRPAIEPEPMAERRTGTHPIGGPERPSQELPARKRETLSVTRES